MGRCFLATYRPLVKSAVGREAIRLHALPPFIDGSCRREPDFESSFPSISATCRGGNFAPRLRIGDRIAYITVKGRYLGDHESGWRFVAVLKVIQRFASHAEAASWYTTNLHPLPSNCLADGNLPKPFEFTNGDPPAAIRKRLMRLNNDVAVIRLWDAAYQRRVDKWPVFLSTTAEFMDLYSPSRLRPADMDEIFGKMPGTLNPPQISCEKLDRLAQLARRGQI